MDVPGRLPRREDPGLRPPRRHLHSSPVGRRGDPHRRRNLLREPAALFPRRADRRASERPERRREPVARRRRRSQSPAGDERQGNEVPPSAHGLSLLDDGRRVPSRFQEPASREDLRPLPLPSGWRRRSPGGSAAPEGRAAGPGTAAGSAAQQAGRRRLTRRPLHLLRRAPRRLQLQRPVPHLADREVRPRDQRDRDRHQRPGERAPSPPLARREVAGLRLPLPHGNGIESAGSRERRRALAPLSRDPGRPGVPRDPGHHARIRFHSRREVAGALRRGQDPSNRFRDGRVAGRSLHGEGRGRDRAPGPFPEPGRRFGDGAGAGHPLALALPRRDSTRLQRFQSRLGGIAPRWSSAPEAHEARDRGVHAHLVSRRTHRRLRDLVDRGGPHLSSGRGRIRRAREAHRPPGVLRRPRVLPGRDRRSSS